MSKKKHLEGMFSKMKEPELEVKNKRSEKPRAKKITSPKKKAGQARSILIPDDLYERAIDFKWENRISVNEVVRRALEKFLPK